MYAPVWFMIVSALAWRCGHLFFLQPLVLTKPESFLSSFSILDCLVTGHGHIMTETQDVLPKLPENN